MKARWFLSLTLLAFPVLSRSPAQPAAAARTAQVHYIDIGQGDAILLEFDKEAVLIDAGGENTTNAAEQSHLVDYLTGVFQRRPDLNKTIDTIIISHPHLDHTMKLMDVMHAFKVKNLIDGGDGKDGDSGIVPLRQARDFVTANGGKHFGITDSAVSAVGSTNPALKAIHDNDPDVDFKLLSGARGCANPNNNSLVVVVTYKAARFIFTGDAEDKNDAACSPEISELIRRNQTGQLRADVYKADHHGSANGTDDQWMTAIAPRISIISAGRSDDAHRQNEVGQFHAFEFGHPRESAVQIIERNTSDNRTKEASVTTMDGVGRIHANRRMSKAVYCTCWDGDIVVEPSADGKSFSVKTSQQP